MVPMLALAAWQVSRVEFMTASVLMVDAQFLGNRTWIEPLWTILFPGVTERVAVPTFLTLLGRKLTEQLDKEPGVNVMVVVVCDSVDVEEAENIVYSKKGPVALGGFTMPVMLNWSSAPE